MADLRAFIAESNRIENIIRPPSAAEIEATRAFVALRELSVPDIVNLVGVYQPNARLRDKPNLNVRVGDHIAPRGGTALVDELIMLLEQINRDWLHPWVAHIRYEDLHPFTDGNGRSGRAIWLWQVERMGGTELNFLHSFYYQTLSGVRRIAASTERSDAP